MRDPNGRELSPREVGELWINTPKLIRNNLRAPTLESTTVDEGGYFRSGDMGRIDEDDLLYITDRAKDMIIRGGQVFFPAEIEAVLLQHPSMQDVAMIGVPKEGLGELVKAFVELKPGHSAHEAELIAFASEKLAFFKRPRPVDVVAELLRNPTGKLLKQELRARHWADRTRHV